MAEWVEGFLSTTWGAVQGSIAVLLIMIYGYASRWSSLISLQGENNISALITFICLPALLFSGIGPSVTASTIIQYWTIIVYSLIYQLICYLYAMLCLKLGIFESRLWTGACIFNNVISLPLLMIESLNSTGALDGIAGSGDIDDAIRRAKTYFLVNALVSHLMSFVFGPHLMSPKPNNDLYSTSSTPSIEDCRTPEGPEPETERTRLLPGPPPESRVQVFWNKLRKFMNPPLLGGLMAVFVGIIPPLHSALLDEGGLFRGSITQSIIRVGDLYTALQMLVVGARLFSSSHLGRREGVHVPKLSITALFILRFVLMPLFSISFIYSVRLWRPDLLPRDPMFDFALMVCPVGPPAIHLAAIAELSKISEGEKGIVSRVLMLSYIVTPFISVPIGAALIVVEREALTAPLSFF